MSVQLRFLVCGSQFHDNNYAHTMIEADGDKAFYDAIMKIKSYDPPTYLGCFIADSKSGDPCYGNLPETDKYGTPHRMVKAGSLSLEHFKEAHYYHNLPIAALKYMDAIDPDTWIVLHWH